MKAWWRTTCVMLTATAACGFPTAPGNGPDGGDRPDGPAPTSDARVDAGGPAIDAPAPDPACGIAHPSLVMCLTFDQPLGANEPDRSGNGNDAALVSVDSMARPTGIGSTELALKFGETSTAVIADDSSFNLAGDLTIGAWVRIDQRPASNNRFGVLDKNNRFSIFVQDNGDVTCSIATVSAGANPGSVSVTTPSLARLQSDLWTHITCRRDDGALSLWMNGLFVNMVAIGPANSLESVVPLRLGQDGDSAGDGDENLLGGLDDVFVVGAALSPAEICAAAGLGC